MELNGRDNKEGDFRAPLAALEAEVARLTEEARSKDEFIQITNHELRTPLDVIRGNLDMVLKGDAGTISEEARAFLGDALLGADRLTKLVNDMLDISRIESRRMHFSLEEVDIRDLLLTLKQEFTPLSEERGATLDVDASDSLPRVFSDRDRLFQVADNLVGNALKFTPRGGIITLRAEAEGDMVRISVRDTGIGIRPEDQEKLFKRFPQIDTSLVTSAKGTGLGLALVWQIVEALGGEVFVHSDGLGKGATFLFTVPQAGTKRAEELSRYHEVFLRFRGPENKQAQ